MKRTVKESINQRYLLVKTEEELIKSGLSYRVSKLPMAYSGRFVAENEQGNGLCKLIQDEEGKIILKTDNGVEIKQTLEKLME